MIDRRDGERGGQFGRFPINIDLNVEIRLELCDN